MEKKLNSFADYKAVAHNWITLATGEYYPDILKDACELYKLVLVMFGQLLKASESSVRLFLLISEVPDGWMRVQLARVFRKYVCPELPVEMTRRRTKAKEIIGKFGKGFRAIHEVQAAYASRPIPDEALCALLWEYKNRGKKGYDLTGRLFSQVRAHLPKIDLQGPERAGKDVLLGTVFKDYPNPKRPADFVLYETAKGRPLAIGFARYDSDRGGAQEDDRTGGYKNCVDEILGYAKKKRIPIKVIFVNDGPGLLLGSMWNDYSALEKSWKGKVLVTTLRMMPSRLTMKWLKSKR